MKTGIDLIAEERQRQIYKEGFTPEHDKQWEHGQLVKAAACYLARPSWVDTPLWPHWPFDISWWKPTPQDRIRELQKAGALIAAEIDRLLKVESNGRNI